MEYDSSQMGQRIAARRKSLKMKQNVLAEQVKRSNNYISSIERGKESPSVNVIVAICNALEVTPDYLLMGTMHSNNVPQNIIDGLRLCSQEDLALIAHLTEYLIQRHQKEWNADNFI